MRASTRLLAVVAVVMMAVSSAAAGPVESHAAALKGADHLLAIQHANGAFPWDLTDPGEYQNVQGVTALGLLDAYLVSLDADYLAGAKKTRDWLASYHANGESGACQFTADPPPCRLSAPNVYFLAQYALLNLSVDDLRLARAVLMQRVDGFGGGASTVQTIVQSRLDQGLGNLGLWDASLYVRAAQDVGLVNVADEMALNLATQEIVDPFAGNSNFYELGLAGLVLGLTEADFAGRLALITGAAYALEATQLVDGSFPTTFNDVKESDIQSTAYAAMALLAAARPLQALAAADYLVAAQEADGGWVQVVENGGYETGETDSEAVSGLVASILLVPNGVAAYADAAKFV